MAGSRGTGRQSSNFPERSGTAEYVACCPVREAGTVTALRAANERGKAMLIGARSHAARILGALVLTAAVLLPLTLPRTASAFGRHDRFAGAHFGFRPFLVRPHVFRRAPGFVRPSVVFGFPFFYGPVGGWPGEWVWIPSYWNGWAWVPGRWVWR
jgi:hypothetical protein